MNNVTFLLPLALIFILYKYNKSKKLKNIKSELLKNWGKTPDINYKNNDLVENYTLSGTWKNKGDEYNEI